MRRKVFKIDRGPKAVKSIKDWTFNELKNPSFSASNKNARNLIGTKFLKHFKRRRRRQTMTPTRFK